METKIALLWPEIVMFITTCVVMIVGLSKSRGVRQMSAVIAALGIAGAGFLAIWTNVGVNTALPSLPMWGKALVSVVGLLIVLLMSGAADRELEEEVDKGRPFEPLRSVRAESWSFILFSLTGLMLCTSADDLIWLFLALELTSLPTYVMAATSTARNRSMEAGVKYFFLGAMGAAVFLYGFALIYGGTGSTNFQVIRDAIATQAAGGGVNTIALLGIVLSIVGVCFKIAAVPMHFYTPDVYQGSSASVAGFLAFVPKAAGFFSIMSLCALVGWRFSGNEFGAGASLPETIRVLLIAIAVLTMTVGNVLAIMQSSIKRMLAYSSIAHSGYMLVGIIAGPGPTGSDFTRNGLAAVLFYLFSYGVTTIGAFAVVACLEKRVGTGADAHWEEADQLDDFRGLALSRPVLGWTMVVCSMSLLGLPPLLGFFAKLPLFTSAISANELPLVIILALNSAIAAYYYLRIAYTCFIEKPGDVPNAPVVEEGPFTPRKMAGVVSVVIIAALAVGGSKLTEYAQQGTRYAPGATRSKAPTAKTQPVQSNEQRAMIGSSR
jgi:NADH-quinone oxidoreductase subunit N